MNIDEHFCKTMTSFKKRKEEAKTKSEVNKIDLEERTYLLKNCKYLEEYYTRMDKIKKDENNKIRLDHNMVIPSSSSDSDNYWKNNIVKVEYYNYTICQKCEGEMIEENGYLYCNLCFHFIPYISNSTSQQFQISEKIGIINNTCYKKINHFIKIINQYRGINTMKIHLDDLCKIKNRIEKERIDKLDHWIIKSILRKLNLRKYTDQCFHILFLFGYKVHYMSDEVFDKLCHLFIALQEPFYKICPKDRSNFFSYSFTLYKLLEYIGEDTKFLFFVPFLKNKEKNRIQNELWGKCILELESKK